MSWAAFLFTKRVWRGNRWREPRAIIFIFGCQRSGTTHLQELFEADPRSVVFGEFSELSNHPDKTVWRRPAEMQQIISSKKAMYAVSRSLYNSDLVSEILDFFPQSVGVWVFRDPRKVVRSMMTKWQGDFRDISRMVESDENQFWRLRKTWDAIDAEIAARSYAPDQKVTRIADTYALYWLARNHLVASDNSLRADRLMFLDYDIYTADPRSAMRSILEISGLKVANWRYPVGTRVSRKELDEPEVISKDILVRCDALLAKLRDRQTPC